LGSFLVFSSITVLSIPNLWRLTAISWPLLPFIYLLAVTVSPKFLSNRYSLRYLLPFRFLSLSYSVDPISNAIWPKTQVLENACILITNLIGDDGHNLQHALSLVMKTRDWSDQIRRLQIPASDWLLITNVKTVWYRKRASNFTPWKRNLLQYAYEN